MGRVHVTLEQRGGHERLVFTAPDGRQCHLTISRGCKVNSRVAAQKRSQLRRPVQADKPPQPKENNDE
jgi:hypothetical protein